MSTEKTENGDAAACDREPPQKFVSTRKFSLDRIPFRIYTTYVCYAGVLELADEADSKSVGLITRAGSTPATGTMPSRRAGSCSKGLARFSVGALKRAFFMEQNAVFTSLGDRGAKNLLVLI